MLPDLPNLKRDIRRVLDQYLQKQVYSRLGIFGEPQAIEEGNRSQVVREDGSIEETKLQEFAARLETPLEKIPRLTLKERTEKLNNIADELASKMISNFFRTLNEGLSKAGQVRDNEGRPLNHETIFSFLEMLQIEFDDNGKHEELSLIVPPALLPQAEKVITQIQSDPKLRKHHEEIINKKRQEWREREASRKLVG